MLNLTESTSATGCVLKNPRPGEADDERDRECSSPARPQRGEGEDEDGGPEERTGGRRELQWPRNRHGPPLAIGVLPR